MGGGVPGKLAWEVGVLGSAAPWPEPLPPGVEGMCPPTWRGCPGAVEAVKLVNI